MKEMRENEYMDKILEVKNLTVGYGNTPVVQNASMTLHKGEIVGLVGESGCGKSTFLRTLMMLTDENAHIMSGTITFENKNLADMTEEQLRLIRGQDISMVFQNSAEACNPVQTIGYHFWETMNCHGEKHSKKECNKKVAELLKQLRLQKPERILKSYPFELSGGMNQRVGIALAMINNPKLILADEPTSALDVTVQMQVLREMYDLKKEFQTAIVLVTHSIGVVAGLCDTVGVMYGGHIVEWGSCEDLLSHPYHPYTKALIEAVPTESGKDPKGIPGMPPDFGTSMPGCPFAPRCARASSQCKKEMPKQIDITDKHRVWCWHLEDNGGGK
ncbi:ABC transporter ATP-binding protein [Ruminococcus sp. AF41-9]|nr:ABC transporter ATP-binding protein [Ruminococcus sp. AF41-9]